MGKAWQDFGMQVAQDTVGSAMGLALSGINDKRQLKQQQKLMDMQMKGNKELTTFNREQALQMWKDTNYQAQMEELRKAGLNPGLIYGMSGGGGATAQISQGNVTGGHAPVGGGEAIAMGQSMAQMGLLRAQKENIDAQTELLKSQKPKTDAETKNILTDTENKVLNSIILKYTGKELQDTYEQVKSPARGVEAKTHQDEMEARQGIAGTIYELWTEGKLKDKANGEIEQILLQNAKTEAEIQNIKETFKLLEQNVKGANLDNIIKDLEAKLQTQTGIDKTSSGILKILGRLFIRLTGGQ